MSDDACLTPSDHRSLASNLEAVALKVDGYRRRFEAARDERAVFAFVYVLMTRALAERLRDRPGDFSDPAWVAALGERFAARYLDTMDAIDETISGEGARGRAESDVPAPWRDVWQSTRGGRSYVLEDMVFSMMAHISHDLPLALLDVGLAHDGQSHIDDYHLMNEVLARHIDEIQGAAAERYQRSLAVLDRLAGNYDEFFTNYGIRLARSAAWYNACRIDDPIGEAQARESIMKSAGAFIDFVRNPKGLWLRVFVKLARFVIPRLRRWPRSTDS